MYNTETGRAISIDEYRALIASKGHGKPRTRASKYNATRTVNGFDSAAEEVRYNDLIMMQRAGLIANLRTQVKIVLECNGIALVHHSAHGAKSRPITYTVDFAYLENGLVVFEDFKGYDTRESRLKRAIAISMGITIKVTGKVGEQKKPIKRKVTRKPNSRNPKRSTALIDRIKD
jgi:hypothetical protein